MSHSIRPFVFWPVFLILMAAVVASFINLDAFLAVTSHLNSLVLDNFSWLFSLGSLYMLVLAVIVYVSPLGRVRIGGENAEPLLSKLRWFSITLCTTLAVGILFWTTAEPLYHYHSPPSGMDIAATSPDAARFAISTMFLHWTLTPYAIYAMPALLFALVLYNRRQRFSIASMFEPLFGFSRVRRVGGLIDAVALYALVAGMASSLGTGALTITGGINSYIGGEASPLKLALVTAAIVVTFVVSAATGLQRGIARLSSLNTWLLLGLGVFVLVTGPTLYMLGLGTESLGNYLDNFFTKSLYTGTAANDDWAQSWSIFYWAVWFAWAPVTALFLGRISRGYTVRDFINIALIFPALFSMIWIVIFSTAALKFDIDSGSQLYDVLSNKGIDQVLYTLFGNLPLSAITVPVLLFVAFISYVTAADSNTDAIGNLCTRGLTADSDMSGALPVKIVWGAVIGIVAWVMTSFVGIDGIKMLSNLGGLPAMLMILLASLSLWRWIADPSRLDEKPLFDQLRERSVQRFSNRDQEDT
ncbi:BCCT family transporter [Kushneria aurantia]|uniref:BCCT family transporter n=1 Tax=Kushneria aurantia TaxID=504092 RepID=A0ABV6G7D6_9GAMM|nr:BCCT family transporter [Kushneria aurantia]